MMCGGEQATEKIVSCLWTPFNLLNGTDAQEETGLSYAAAWMSATCIPPDRKSFF